MTAGWTKFAAFLRSDSDALDVAHLLMLPQGISYPPSYKHTTLSLSACSPIARPTPLGRHFSTPLLQTRRSTGPAIVPSAGTSTSAACTQISRARAWGSSWRNGVCRGQRKRAGRCVQVCCAERRIAASTQRPAWECRSEGKREREGGLPCLQGDVAAAEERSGPRLPSRVPCWYFSLAWPKVQPHPDSAVCRADVSVEHAKLVDRSLQRVDRIYMAVQQ